MGSSHQLSIYGSTELLNYLDTPLFSLGITATKVGSESFKLNTESYLSLLFARSEQGQSALWPIAEHRHYRRRLVTSMARQVQQTREAKIIDLAQYEISKLTWTGSGLIRMTVDGELIDVLRGAQPEGMWTINHSSTSIFENEVRARFNLPLGDISDRSSDWMTMEFSASEELDMLRPYLHLCARNPRYKFHHFDTHSGVVSLDGENSAVREDLEHAVDYLEGVINE